ncbi:hypothetical protein [Mucilaginibacter galii]|uniref:hypothetical protein n=1 Tax=Mucilaginibacter galii TaxID=2005073 RepID=UPI001E50FDF2|nr:hypothetical protein [Mucilaginibacter galii]
MPFVVCLLLLIVNDFFLKAAFHNTLTGKLSDLCGLFIFPIFWSALFPRYKLWVFILSGILFIYWKSEYASTVIEFVSAYFFNIQRTVDLSDLVALPVLFLAWLSLNKEWKTTDANRLLRHAGPYFIAVVTVFSFCATSQPRYVQSFDQPQYVLFKTNVVPDSNSFQEDFKFYHLDSLLVVKVNQLYSSKQAAKDDDYQKNLVIRNLDEDVFSIVPGIKSLMTAGKVTSITLRTAHGNDFLRFNGGRLDGKFVSKKGEKTIIEGFYKKGIEDSIWTFGDTSSALVTKVKFINGERTQIQQFKDDKLVSSNTINTRTDTIRNKGIQIGVLILCMISMVFLLVKNYLSTLHKKLQIKLGFKWLLCLVLPVVVWIFQLIITLLLGDNHHDIFEMVAIFFLLYISTCPLFFIIVFLIRLSKQIDIIWYCLSFALAFNVWKAYGEFLMLSI